jgi:hypothetical protein
MKLSGMATVKEAQARVEQAKARETGRSERDSANRFALEMYADLLKGLRGEPVSDEIQGRVQMALQIYESRIESLKPAPPIDQGPCSVCLVSGQVLARFDHFLDAERMAIQVAHQHGSSRVVPDTPGPFISCQSNTNLLSRRQFDPERGKMLGPMEMIE